MSESNIYLIKRTYTDLKNPSEIAYKVAIPSTFADLKAAKAAALATLIDEGYEPGFFPVYEVNHGDAAQWTHGDGMMVYAEGPDHEIFTVEIGTRPNDAHFEADETGRIRRPLHHVIQTIVDYSDDRSGSKRKSMVEGTHIARSLAESQALRVLLDANVRKEDFVEYDEFIEGERPFGEDVIVHAVKDGGENILVSVVSSTAV
jgi:hypothetical protein